MVRYCWRIRLSHRGPRMIPSQDPVLPKVRPIDDGTFDAVLCANAFHHSPRPGATLGKIRRVAVVCPGRQP